MNIYITIDSPDWEEITIESLDYELGSQRLKNNKLINKNIFGNHKTIIRTISEHVLEEGKHHLAIKVKMAARNEN